MADDPGLTRKIRELYRAIRGLQEIEVMQRKLDRGELAAAVKTREPERLPMAMHGIGKRRKGMEA